MKVFSFFSKHSFSIWGKRKGRQRSRKGYKKPLAHFFPSCPWPDNDWLEFVCQFVFFVSVQKRCPPSFFISIGMTDMICPPLSVFPLTADAKPHTPLPLETHEFHCFSADWNQCFEQTCQPKKIISILCSHSRLFWTVMKQKERPMYPLNLWQKAENTYQNEVRLQPFPFKLYLFLKARSAEVSRSSNY